MASGVPDDRRLVTHQDFTMHKIGRNDPCPSGSGEKFKKCLAAHPCLGSHSSAAEIWWVCERWQTQTPTLDELRGALTGMADVSPVKFDAFLEMVFAAPPATVDFWRTLLIQCRAKRHQDLAGVFRRMSAHLVATGNPDLPWLYSAAATCLREDHPEMFSEVLAATLALDPVTTPMESLEILVEWADELERTDDCQRLRDHFPEFPEYMIEEPEEEFTTDDSGTPDEKPEPDFPPEVHAAIDKVWEDFDALDSPSHEQAEAFVEELLVLPLRATEWNQVFDVVQRTGHPDMFKIFHRLAAALAPTRNNDFAYVCWGAVERLGRLKTPERLPEIARTLLDFNPQSCDPDALSHIADALLAHGHVNEVIELMAGFLPSLRDNDDVVSWVVPRVAEEIFLLRLGALILSGDYSRQSVDQLVTGLCADLDDDICEESVKVPVLYLMRDGENFTREQFMVPSSTKKPDQQKLLWDGLQHAFVEVARDAWQTENRNPSKTLSGLHMIYRAVEDWLARPKEKGGKYPLNLLDYLTPAAMERLVLIECSDVLGINPERARIMLDACVVMIRWSGRRGLLAGTDAANAEKSMATLMRKIDG